MFRSKYIIKLIIAGSLFASCSSTYELMKVDDVYTAQIQSIKFNAFSMKPFLWGHDKTDPGKFSFSLTLNVEKGRELKLSALKITLVEGTNADTAHVSPLVKLHTQANNETTGKTENIDEDILKGDTWIDLKGNTSYNFNYSFLGANHKHYAPEVKVIVEASINNNGKIALVNKAFYFKKVTYLNVAGN
jgi:hypothetical protein